MTIKLSPIAHRGPACDPGMPQHACEVELPHGAWLVPQEPRWSENVCVSGDFFIKGFLGEGGTADVYLAEHGQEKREVALKVLRPEAHYRPMLALFNQEAALAHRIVHPNLCRSLDASAGTTVIRGPSECRYYAMESLRGTTLSVGQRSLEDVVGILRHVVRGLGALHAQGIIHGDLKPGNIFLSVTSAGRFTAKVLDLGLARVANADILAGDLCGTREYFAPELPFPTLRSDLYSLGVMAYEMATGFLPVLAREQTPEGWLAAHRTVAPLPFQPTDNTCPRLSRLIMRMLEKEPSHRPASCREIEDELTAILGEVRRSKGPLGSPCDERTGGCAPLPEGTAAMVQRRELMSRKEAAP